jgi:hypothetical protein
MRYGLVKITGAFVLLCLPLQAWATGGLGCSISDGNLDFHYEALFSYSANSSLFQGKAEFLSKHAKTHPALKALDTEKLRLIQQWYEGKDLRLQFYSETQDSEAAFGSIKLTIQTVAAEDELSYAGTYRLEIQPVAVEGQENETVSLEGKVACSAG